MISFFLSRYGMMSIALLVSVVGFQAWKVQYGYLKKEEGKAIVIEQSKTEGKKLNVEAKKRSDRVYSDDKYFDAGMRKWCRDCK